MSKIAGSDTNRRSLKAKDEKMREENKKYDGSNISEEIALIKETISGLYDVAQRTLPVSQKHRDFETPEEDKLVRFASPLYWVRRELIDSIYELEQELKVIYTRHYSRTQFKRALGRKRPESLRVNLDRLESNEEDLQ